MTNKLEGLRIEKRVPDTNEKESSYSTAIYIKDRQYPIVGYGFTPETADASALNNLLSLTEERGCGEGEELE